MIGIGPYIAHPATPLGSGALRPPIDPAEQAPSTRRDGLQDDRAGAHCLPDRKHSQHDGAGHDQQGAMDAKQGLQAGANVVMPNLTPVKYRQPLPDLSRQGLHRGKRHRLQPMPARADSLAGPLCRTRAGRKRSGRRDRDARERSAGRVLAACAVAGMRGSDGFG